MTNCSQLPLWVSSLQALAVPIIALAGTWIAARQMLIADEKWRLDAFKWQYDRRVAVYETTRKFLASVFAERNFSEGDIRAYGLYTLDAQFLFDDELYKYLRGINQRVNTWYFAKSEMERLPSGDERDEFERIKTDSLNWIVQQGDEKTGFATKFAPFLALKQPKRPWLLRWP
jgi:hypothetical protein